MEPDPEYLEPKYEIDVKLIRIGLERLQPNSASCSTPRSLSRSSKALHELCHRSQEVRESAKWSC